MRDGQLLLPDAKVRTWLRPQRARRHLGNPKHKRWLRRKRLTAPFWEEERKDDRVRRCHRATWSNGMKQHENGERLRHVSPITRQQVKHLRAQLERKAKA